jgi:hypothetical protein
MERENQQTPDGLELADGLHNGPLVLATRAHAKRKEHPSLFICAHNRIFLARRAVLRVDHRADPLHDRRHGRGLDRGGRVRRAWFLASGKDGRDEKEQNANRGKHLGTDEDHFGGLAARADSAVAELQLVQRRQYASPTNHVFFVSIGPERSERVPSSKPQHRKLNFERAHTRPGIKLAHEAIFSLACSLQPL